jgi:hypothetical protein
MLTKTIASTRVIFPRPLNAEDSDHMIRQARRMGWFLKRVRREVWQLRTVYTFHKLAPLDDWRR